jgi:hypothetical protein
VIADSWWRPGTRATSPWRVASSAPSTTGAGWW